MSRRALVLGLLAAVATAAMPGCSPGVSTTYGRSRSPSINGTGVFADLFRSRGHDVRVAVRLTDELSEWAEVIVRFAPSPGLPPRDEADWYRDWLDAERGRRLVYVPRDYNAIREYWTLVREQLPPDASARTQERIEQAISEAEDWAAHLPPRPSQPASPDDWFELKSGPPTVCKTLGGPWSRGVDPAAAALTRHKTFEVDAERVLLSGDGEPLVIARALFNGSRVLAAAGGPFLLNLPLTVPARRPLALRVVRWAEGGEEDDQDEPSDADDAGTEAEAEWAKRVAFVEGPDVAAGEVSPPSVFDLLYVSPFGRVAAQLFAFGLAACLARAPRLGRPRPEEPSGADRPAAHPEALGDLLARTRQAREARSILETYRRWRAGPAAPRAPDG
jgi:hypothetical protein